jgi:hypothetical protein
MKIVIEEVAQTRLRIEPDPELVTHDDAPAEPACAERVTWTGVDFKGGGWFLVTDPSLIGRYKPGQHWGESLEALIEE